MGLMVLASALGADAADAQMREEMRMEDAGFIMRPANTPEAMAKLRLVPPRKMVARTRDGQRYYIYADPDGCKCAMVGNEQALQTWRNMPPNVTQPDNVARSGPNPAGLLIHEMDEDAFRGTFPGDLLDYKMN